MLAAAGARALALLDDVFRPATGEFNATPVVAGLADAPVTVVAERADAGLSASGVCLEAGVEVGEESA